jgi:Protein tyrosine and serine/threonine kinase
MVLYELLFHQKPFELYSLEMLQFLVGDEQERPVIPSTCPPHLQECLKESWDATPRNRPTWDTLQRALVVTPPSPHGS